MPKIQLTAPDGTSLEFELRTGSTRFGRAEDNDFVVPDGSVSSRHGEMHLKGDSIEIVDLGSTNGTYVGGEKVERATIAPGGKFRIGSVEGVLVGAAPAVVEKTETPAEELEVEEESRGEHLSLPSLGGAAVVTGLGTTPCPTGRRVGFGPKTRAKDSFGSALIFFAVVSLLICAAAAYMIFKMEA